MEGKRSGDGSEEPLAIREMGEWEGREVTGQGAQSREQESKAGEMKETVRLS